MLEVRDLQAGYGASEVLFGVDLGINAGEVVTLLGRNGMGKTTTVRSIMGLIRPCAGRVVFAGRELQHLPPYAIARAGLGLVPEGRQIFPNLSVRENLVATAANRNKTKEPWIETSIYALFPRLAERSAHMGYQLSGGEQQMLAIGRALMTNPRLLILDEATEGLAPQVRKEIWRCLTLLKQRGQAILVIDKNLNDLLTLADRHYVMEKGRVVWCGDSTALAGDEALRRRHLSV